MAPSNSDRDEQDEARFQRIANQLKIESRIRNGANWFFWIAGLSFINTVILSLGGDIRFFFGLGVTQVIDGVTYILRTEFAPQASAVFTFTALLLDLFVIGVFVAIGIFARRNQPLAFYIGLALYFLDGLVLAVFRDFLAVGIHLIAIAGIYQGLKSLRELQRWSANQLEVQQRIDRPLAKERDEVDPAERRRKLLQFALLISIPFLIGLCFIIVMILSY